MFSERIGDRRKSTELHNRDVCKTELGRTFIFRCLHVLQPSLDLRCGLFEIFKLLLSAMISMPQAGLAPDHSPGM